MFSYGCQQILITPDPNLKAVLEFICEESNKLANCGIYYSRQIYFKTGRIAHKYELHKILGNNPHFKAFQCHVAQQCLTTVAESFSSFIGLLKGIKNAGRVSRPSGTVGQKPKLPNYRAKDGLNVVTFLKNDVKLKDKGLRFPLGARVKAWFGLDAFYMPMPSNLDYKSIKEYRILPRNGCFYLELVYKTQSVAANVDLNKVLGIDHGLNNWLTCLSNVGTSFIVDGLHLKSLNQFYNKQVSNIKANKPQYFWSKTLAAITEKRNRQMRDGINKAARLVINHCVENRIGTIVFGWNKGQKDGANMGRQTNQKFVQVPTGKLKDRIAQLCEQHGIRFVETEESYTSKASFLDSDSLPVFGAKPEGWNPSGKRPKRGLYRSSNGTKINADCNGAGNIIRKVAATLGINLDGVSSGALKTPMRVRLWRDVCGGSFPHKARLTVHESPALANQSACGLEA
jgi:putative transposase